MCDVCMYVFVVVVRIALLFFASIPLIRTSAREPGSSRFLT